MPIFPFWLVNLVPALCGVRLATFVAATAIGIIPATFVFAFVGAGLDSVIAAQQAAYSACVAAGRPDCRLDFDLHAAITPELSPRSAALGVLALVPVVVKRLRARTRRRARSCNARDRMRSTWTRHGGTLTPDICVIGAGAGGLSVAAAAAAFGVPVVLIEKGRMGGECLNTGCVPSKALIAAAKRAARHRRGEAVRRIGGTGPQSISPRSTSTCTT